MQPLLSQATSPSSEYFNDSHSRVLTRHWLFYRASRPTGCGISLQQLGGLGWEVWDGMIRSNFEESRLLMSVVDVVSFREIRFLEGQSAFRLWV